MKIKQIVALILIGGSIFFVNGVCENTVLVSAETNTVNKDFQVEGTVLKKYTGHEEHIVIPDGITVIGTKAFADVRKEIKSIVLPDSVVEIKAFAFVNSTLEKVTCSRNLKIIGMRAFDGSKKLKEISGLEKVEYIGGAAFGSTPWLEGQLKENKVLILGRTLYDARNYVGDLVIPDTVKTIRDAAFSGNEQLTSVTIPNSVITIGSSAFSKCSTLTSITIPDSVKTIGRGAFSDCKNLESISLPNGLKTIEAETFAYCYSLKELKIPKAVTVIEKDSFAGCDALEQLEIPKSVKRIDGDFSKESPWVKQQLENSPLLIINDNLVLVTNLTEEDCKKIAIPKGVKRISERAFALFEGKGEIEEIIIPDTVTAIGSQAFSFCISLKKMEIPNSVRHIGSAIFEGCKKLEKIKLSNHLKTIPDFTFEGCKSLKQITFPESVTTFGEYPLTNSSKLKNVVFSDKVKNIFSIVDFDYPKDLVIHAPKGSYMETVAKKANVTFKPLAINKTKVTIKKKGTVQLNIATDTTYTTWKSSNSSIASVNSTGKVTGKKKGTATITGVLYGKKYSCKVTVR